jgi:hypothetical protein
MIWEISEPVLLESPCTSGSRRRASACTCHPGGPPLPGMVPVAMTSQTSTCQHIFCRQTTDSPMQKKRPSSWRTIHAGQAAAELHVYEQQQLPANGHWPTRHARASLQKQTPRAHHPVCSGQAVKSVSAANPSAPKFAPPRR